MVRLIICSNCKEEKPHDAKGMCSNCYLKNWRNKNKSYDNLISSLWRINNTIKVKISSRKTYLKYKTKILNDNKQWAKNNPIKRNKIRRKYEKKRKKIDLNYKLREILSCRIQTALREQYGIKAYKSLRLLGVEKIEIVRNYLKSLFKPKMIWGNHGLLWQIDHIIPCYAFDLTIPREQKMCFYYKNLQPMWCKENSLKGAKYNIKDLEEYKKTFDENGNKLEKEIKIIK